MKMRKIVKSIEQRLGTGCFGGDDDNRRAELLVAAYRKVLAERNLLRVQHLKLQLKHAKAAIRRQQ